MVVGVGVRGGASVVGSVGDKVGADVGFYIRKFVPFSADVANQKRGGARKPGASAERKFILKVEKSTNPEVLGCFS